MESSASPAQAIRIGAFEVDLRAGELRKYGTRIRLQEQPFQILAMLLERSGHLVTREELRQKLWSGDTFVDFDHGLNNAMNRLREALGDSAESPRFIETVPRRGYRFIAVVEPLSSPVSESPKGASPAPATGDISSPGPPPAGPPLEQGSKAVPPGLAVPKTWVWGIGSLLAILFITWFATSRIFNRPRLLPAKSSQAIQSLAVLPLENLSGDASQEYFADAMTDELTTELARAGALRVISRNSAMHYKRTGKTLPEIGRELNVDAVVEGSVMRSGSRVRITAQLIDARSDHYLWADSYERDFREILALQSTVAHAIASQIRTTMRPQQPAPQADSRPVNSEAYESYIQGRYFFFKETAGDWETSRQDFQHAIAVDPNFAPAYSGLADYYIYLGAFGLVAPRKAFPAAEKAAAKAIELDDTLAEAHTSLAHAKLLYDWDWVAGEKELNRALELNPNYAQAHRVYCLHLGKLGRFDQSIAEAKKALVLDPFSLPTHALQGQAYFFARKYDQAIEEFLKTLQMDQRFARAHSGLGRAYLQLGRYQDAIAEFQKAAELSGGQVDHLAELAYGYAVAGERGRAIKILDRLQKESKRHYISPYFMATIYAGLQQNDQALQWLQKAFDERSSLMTRSKTNPDFDGLQTDPRYQQLLRRVGFPP